MYTFKDMNLKDSLINGLKKDGIIEPTPVQSKIIDKILLHNDVIAQSSTGSGKTLAYLLPIFNKIDFDLRKVQAIIITPTHELAAQVNNEIKKLAKNSKEDVRTSLLIGGVNIKRQIKSLKNKPQIVVGSTGRMLKLISKRKLKPHTVKTIVIDEADRMLSLDNIKQTKAVIKTTLRDRQLVMVSATIQDETLEVATNMMKDPDVVFIKEKLINKNVYHSYMEVERRDKTKVLRKLIRSINPKKTIVFINKNEIIQTVVKKLRYHKLKVEGIYGAASKHERHKAILNFKKGKSKILIASDIAARGLDIKGVSHIINLDLPEDPDEYLHRIGRSGRGKRPGNAITLATEYEVGYLNRLAYEYDINIELKTLSKGKFINKI